uniref:Uncharacterized protein n=1 Tax=Oryza punctata TaxID=4537 RepID=A0A0E0MEX8_ORYPU
MDFSNSLEVSPKALRAHILHHLISIGSTLPKISIMTSSYFVDTSMHNDNHRFNQALRMFIA